MDPKLSRSLMHSAAFLIFLGLWWSPVFSAPTSTILAHLHRTEHHAGVFKLEAEQLLNFSIRTYGDKTKSIRPEVPDSSVSGSSFTEKLQDICNKSRRFQFHLAQAEDYHKDLLHKSKNASTTFNKTLIRLRLLTNEIGVIVGAEACGLTTPAPEKLPSYDMYKKSVYVVGVAARLAEWSGNVLKAVEEAKNKTVLAIKELKLV